MKLKEIDASLETLRIFLYRSLGLTKSMERSVSAHQLMAALVSAAAFNTYVETVSDKADTLNRHIKGTLTSIISWVYLEQTTRLARIKGWGEKNVLLAVDYTDEVFYGDVQGLDIHGWTGKEGVTGHFKFLTVSIVSDDIPERIPLLSTPIQMGHYKSHAVLHLLRSVAPLFKGVELTLFDRGFYDKDLMFELENNGFKYLIFTPKSKDKKEILCALEDGDHIAIENTFVVNKAKTKYAQDNTLVFLKQIFSASKNTHYDWVFATNCEDTALGNIIGEYIKRWRIETGFRVQDDARIKCKSKDLLTRYFIFMFTQLMQANWMCFYKTEVSFKRYVIELAQRTKDK